MRKYGLTSCNIYFNAREFMEEKKIHKKKFIINDKIGINIRL